MRILARPSITSISNNITLNETNDVTLSCTASGKPPPNVTWTKADDVGNVLSKSSSLELKNITRKQEGLYRCTADNGLGKAESSVRIIVQCKYVTLSLYRCKVFGHERLPLNWLDYE